LQTRLSCLRGILHIRGVGYVSGRIVFSVMRIWSDVCIQGSVPWCSRGLVLLGATMMIAISLASCDRRGGVAERLRTITGRISALQPDNGHFGISAILSDSHGRRVRIWLGSGRPFVEQNANVALGEKITARGLQLRNRGLGAEMIALSIEFLGSGKKVELRHEYYLEGFTATTNP